MGNCTITPSDEAIRRFPEVDGTPIKRSSIPIIFIFGGSGAGKRTQCMRIAQNYNFVGFDMGSVLHEEVSKRTERGILLACIITDGKPVPANIVVTLLKEKMLNYLATAKGFVVSDFPRHSDQGKLFDAQVRVPDLVLHLEARNSVLYDRIMGRMMVCSGTGLLDFHLNQKGVKQFRKNCGSIRRLYKRKLVIIDGEQDSTDVLRDICKVVDALLLKLRSETKSQAVSQV